MQEQELDDAVAKILPIIVDDNGETLDEYKEAFENWLRNEVVPACEALKANPDAVYTPDEVMAHISARHAERTKHYKK